MSKLWQSRLSLHRILSGILKSRNVYFQPPESVGLHYPAIVYSLSNIRPLSADDLKYINRITYTVTLIDKNPESEFVNDILKIPYSAFDRSYVSDNLNHFVFTIYH